MDDSSASVNADSRKEDTHFGNRQDYRYEQVWRSFSEGVTGFQGSPERPMARWMVRVASPSRDNRKRNCPPDSPRSHRGHGDPQRISGSTMRCGLLTVGTGRQTTPALPIRPFCHHHVSAMFLNCDGTSQPLCPIRMGNKRPVARFGRYTLRRLAIPATTSRSVTS
jgi:hypothetical protein